MEEGPSILPLASVPSTGKLTRMLGPQIAALQPDDGGLLLKSRGKIPFATKFMLFPFADMPMMFTMIGGF